MLPDTSEKIEIKPWTFSRNTLPVQTRSLKVLIHCGKGRPLRPRAQRKKHFLSYQDALRMLLKVVPPEDTRQDLWTYKFITALKDATLNMLERILIIVPDGIIEDLYGFAIGILDKLFGKIPYDYDRQSIARTIINEVARKADLNVSFEEVD